MLTARAHRMMDTLPVYYQGEPLIERIIQAWANEADRQHGLLDTLRVELHPGHATDRLGLLGAWEMVLGLPVRPPGATETQRQGKVNAALRAIGSGSGADVLETLRAAIGSANVIVHRNEPSLLTDTIEIPIDPDSYTAAAVSIIARRSWPAHRGLLMRYEGGFILDLSRLDADVF